VVVLNEVVWGIFWKVFRRSCGLPTRSAGPTDRSASLLVGRTYLSGTTVSLVGGDPGVPMSQMGLSIPTSPGPITRGVNPTVTLVGANKHSCHCCRLCHLSSEAKKRQQSPGCFGPEINIVSIIYFCFLHSQGGRLYNDSMT
jgi:hypothetical protein